MTNKSLLILLADDDESDRLLFKEALEELELKLIVQTLSDGVELMAFLNEEKAILPQLVFLDLNMPRKNGLECLKEIRSNKKLKDIFVAIYSTSGSERDIEETFRNGANVYITKPNDFSTLKQLLSKAVITTHLYQENSFNKENFILRI